MQPEAHEKVILRYCGEGLVRYSFEVRSSCTWQVDAAGNAGSNQIALRQFIKSTSGFNPTIYLKSPFLSFINSISVYKNNEVLISIYYQV